MAQHNNVAAPVRRYTRADFTALRFRLNKVPITHIYSNVYHEDLLDEHGLHSPAELEAWLDEMRDHLVERVCLSNPYLSQNLADARKFNSWPKSAIDFLVKAAEQDFSRPKPDDSVSAWFKPIVFGVLRGEHIHTLADLKRYIEVRGSNWHRPVPRIGQGKARAIERWLRANATTLGVLEVAEEPPRTDLVELTPDVHQGWVPLERIGRVTHSLDGSQGRNRASGFCLIAARNDLEALEAYLYRYRDRPKTLRSYKKELERFLYWCVRVPRKALSDLAQEECERYKDFLANPDPAWVGKKFSRASKQWRPFAGPLAPESQAYATQVLRAFFSWLVDVRYLGGNPWRTVKDPLVAKKELSIAIDKALPAALWAALTREGGVLDLACARHQGAPRVGPLGSKDPEAPAAQDRLARAAILLMGTTGIRREEAAHATRDKLKPVPEQAGNPNGLWELAVLGKRKKWRTVFLPPRAIEALRAHWADRGHDFEYPMQDLALLSPVVVTRTPAARTKHLTVREGQTVLSGKGYSPDGLYGVVTDTLLRIANDETLPMEPLERALLKRVAPHALRHTFATQSAAKKMPVDVLQRLLGHAHMQTTTIYVNAERNRSIEEVAKLYGSGS